MLVLRGVHLPRDQRERLDHSQAHLHAELEPPGRGGQEGRFCQRCRTMVVGR